MHRACDAAAEQVASILVGSVPSPSSSKIEKYDHKGTRHASFVLDRPSTSSLEDTDHPDMRRAASINLGELAELKADDDNNNVSNQPLSGSLVNQNAIAQSSKSI